MPQLYCTVASVASRWKRICTTCRSWRTFKKKKNTPSFDLTRFLIIHKVFIMHESSSCSSLVYSHVQTMQHLCQVLHWKWAAVHTWQVGCNPWKRSASLLCSGMCLHVGALRFCLSIQCIVSVLCHRWLVYLIMFVWWNKNSSFYEVEDIFLLLPFLQSCWSSVLIFSNKCFWARSLSVCHSHTLFISLPLSISLFL